MLIKIFQGCGSGVPCFETGEAHSVTARSGSTGSGRLGSACGLNAERRRRHALEAERESTARVTCADEHGSFSRAVVVHIYDRDTHQAELVEQCRFARREFGRDEPANVASTEWYVPYVMPWIENARVSVGNM